MHLRRALLLFAIVLMVAALAATLAPPGRDSKDDAKRTQTTATAPQPKTSAGGHTEQVTLDGRKGKPHKVDVALESHVMLRVPVSAPGDVTIGKLGLVDSATPGTPATFDFIADAPGALSVEFEPPEGNNEPLGTLEVAKRR